ncbi:MAG: hypothetical protein M3280_09635 [Actinomycetota bacterium]|nr:hypothetical protein [Actinomycetota bacterium]
MGKEDKEPRPAPKKPDLGVRCTLILGLVLSLLGGFALADTRSTNDDGNDSATDLDIAQVTHSHHGKLLRHDVRMQEAWTNEEFRSINARIFLPDGDRSYDRQLVIHINPDGSFRGNFYGQRRLRGFANVYRVDNRTIRFELTKKLISDAHLDRYAYRVIASGTFDCPPDVICKPPPGDAVPNSGRIRHNL